MKRAAPWLLVLALATSVALAWDTATTKNPDDSESWESAYRGGPPAQLLPAPGGFTRNEHAELAHLAFQELGIHGLFGIRTPSTGLARHTIVDLNAALARGYLLRGKPTFGDDPSPGADLEERLLPTPAQFAGLPDFTFTVYDWINKSLLCPPLAPDNHERCHVYYGGHLTLFNSSHFGTQATHMYQRYHTIALNLAARAQALRTTLEARSAADAAAHEVYVKERELEALAYEGFAQHFLQDRWSLGHMWERWNGADAKTSADLLIGSLVGGTAGLIHGSEALTGLPDPMSSPYVTESPFMATPLVWLRGADRSLYPGLGDERLLDIYDGAYGLEYGWPDMTIAAPRQRAGMLDCSKAGWVEVIQAFGRNGQGNFGAWNVPLPATAFPPVLSDVACWDNWVTNEAIRTGWVDDLVASTVSELSRRIITVTGGIPGAEIPTSVLKDLRSELMALTARIRAWAEAAPFATNLARKDVGTFLGVPTGNQRAFVAQGVPYLPDYAEPESFDELPDIDARGRDQGTVFGFFSRAHVDHWCGDVATRLEPLRGSTDPVYEAACAYLADRVYKGTDAAYRGVRREILRQGTAEIEPICATFGVQTAGVDEALPYRLHPGYVATPGARGPYAHESILAWCRKAAVIDRETCPGPTPADGDAAWDLAARIPVEGGAVSLRGRHFGTSPGEVRAGSDGGPYTVVVPVASGGGSWTDTDIRLDIPPNLLPRGDSFLQVCPAGDPGRCSVGRAILRVGGDPCLVNHPLVGHWIFTDYAMPPMAPTSWGNYYFLPDGAVMSTSGGGTWFQIASWSASGETVSVQPCTNEGDNFREAPSFQGTWSAHPVTENFGVVSCVGANQDVCPAMKGMLSHFFPGGPVFDRGKADTRFFGGNRGYFPIRSTTLQDFRCHGGCREAWEYHWPDACGREYQTCAGRRQSGVPFVCGTGTCPQGLQCGPVGNACGCR